MPKKPARKRPSKYTASRSDRYVLYQMAVQNPESEIDFVDDTYKQLRGARASRLREDFCGTGLTACEWVRRRGTNTAVGLDLDPVPLAWGQEHNVLPLKPAQRQRVQLLERNVLSPGAEGSGVDIVLAMNFSYWIFQTRAEMRKYFRSVLGSLNDKGVMFLDFYGGWDAQQLCREKRDIDDDFTYVWDQHEYNPITGQMQCYIDFEFPDNTKMKRAFSYNWRLWGLPEIQDVLKDAGFRDVTVYWEGDDGDGGGDGDFQPSTEDENCPSFICYMAALK